MGKSKSGTTVARKHSKKKKEQKYVSIAACLRCHNTLTAGKEPGRTARAVGTLLRDSGVKPMGSLF